MSSVCHTDDKFLGCRPAVITTTLPPGDDNVAASGLDFVTRRLRQVEKTQSMVAELTDALTNKLPVVAAKPHKIQQYTLKFCLQVYLRPISACRTMSSH
jgi:7-keto-8-aminopelargonate synthetase-like enzyme